MNQIIIAAFKSESNRSNEKKNFYFSLKVFFFLKYTSPNEGLSLTTHFGIPLTLRTKSDFSRKKINSEITIND